MARARQEAGGSLEAFELISAEGLGLVLRHVPGSRLPLEVACPWYILVEVTAVEDGGAERIMERILTAALEEGLAQDAAIAQSQGQAAAFWALRENQSAAQKSEGMAWKHDVSVPIPAIPEFLDRAGQAMRALSPGVRIPAFGHAGDGNLHYDILPADGGDYGAHMALRDQAAQIINALVVSMGGSISAEHGIGVMKAKEAVRYKDPVEIAAFRAIRASLDPMRILNPRVLF